MAYSRCNCAQTAVNELLFPMFDCQGITSVRAHGTLFIVSSKVLDTFEYTLQGGVGTLYGATVYMNDSNEKIIA